MQNQIHNQNVVRTSKLGKLYEQKQGLRDLSQISTSVLQSFEFFITVGETLPITASPVELVVSEMFSPKDVETILSNLKEQGCVVNYKYEQQHLFTLIELL